MRSKIYLIGTGICLAVLLFAGCGGEYAGLTEGDAVSGSAVSGEAVSGDAIREKPVSGPAVENEKDGMSGKKVKQDMSSHRFCTDTNLYYISYDEEKLMQARTDGTHRKCIKEWPAKTDEENSVEVVYADENWLYYDVVFDYEEEITYRAPIEKDAQGYDVVKFQEEEELVKTGLMIPLYADSEYYFYEDLDTDQVVKYDLKRKTKDSEADATSYSGSIFRIKDHYVMVTEFGEIYVQNIDSAKWKRVSRSTDGDESEELFVDNTVAVFYPQYITEKKKDRGFQIKRYDGKQEKDFVTWEQLDHAVKEAAGVEKLDVCMPNRLFWQDGRLYIQLQTGWMKDGTYHMGYMIFSQGENEYGSGFRYEKGLTEHMKSHVKERAGKWSGYDFEDKKETVFVEHMVVSDAQCIAMVEGKAYLSLFDHEKDKGRLGCYDLNTGKFEWIGKKDAAFYKLGYDCGFLYESFRTVFDDHDDNEFMDDWWWPPSKAEGDDGEFVEDRKK